MLFSGGLDSLLVTKILQAQGIEATPVCFESYFFSCEKAKECAQKNGIKLRVEDISEAHLKIVKNPDYGRGAGANPCIDCHLLMIQIAGKIMVQEGFDFIATGEVVGQRPMSQNQRSLSIITQKSGLSDKILRPLSAKLLPPIDAENDGLVDRNRLYGLSGRSRRSQLALAKIFNIQHIPQPGGGCILTDSEYGRQLKILTEKNQNFTGSDAKILRRGRVIWQGDLLVIIARDQNECQDLKNLAQIRDFFFEPRNFSGPAVLIRDFGKRRDMNENLFYHKKIAAMGREYVLRYSKKIPLSPEISAMFNGRAL